jgi:hypothetical protein
MQSSKQFDGSYCIKYAYEQHSGDIKSSCEKMLVSQMQIDFVHQLTSHHIDAIEINNISYYRFDNLYGQNKSRNDEEWNSHLSDERVNHDRCIGHQFVPVQRE